MAKHDISGQGDGPVRAVSPFTAGLKGRCPRCGEGNLFAGYLDLAPACDACGLDYAFADSGDGPAVFIMMVVGFIVVGLALVTEIVFQPPYWVHVVLWLPLLLGLSLGMLRPFKATLIALQYVNRAQHAQ